MRAPVLLSTLIALTLVACHHGTTAAPDPFSNSSPTVTPSFSPTLKTAPPSASPTPPALPTTPPATSGRAGSACVRGWVTPPAGSSRFQDPLGLIDRITHHQGPLSVVDMRFFIGPESPPSKQGYIMEIGRWYVKVYDPNDLRFQGRFLLERNRFGRGVVAVAPYDTRGFSSPDWSGFQWDAGDLTQRSYPGLPGTWEGIRYDFVTGGAGLTIPGLPTEVLGCLAGT